MGSKATKKTEDKENILLLPADPGLSLSITTFAFIMY